MIFKRLVHIFFLSFSSCLFTAECSISYNQCADDQSAAQVVKELGSDDALIVLLESGVSLATFVDESGTFVDELNAAGSNIQKMSVVLTEKFPLRHTEQQAAEFHEAHNLKRMVMNPLACTPRAKEVKFRHRLNARQTMFWPDYSLLLADSQQSDAEKRAAGSLVLSVQQLTHIPEKIVFFGHPTVAKKVAERVVELLKCQELSVSSVQVVGLENNQPLEAHDKEALEQSSDVPSKRKKEDSCGCVLDF